MIKLIASDMDGTLLGNKMEVLQENIDAIKVAEEHGVKFMVATGRGYTEAKPALDDAGITCPMITVNGAQAFDEQGQELFTISIDKKHAQTLLDLLKQHNVYFEIATDQGVYSDNPHKRIENAAQMLAGKLPHLTFKMAIAMASAHLELLDVNYVDHYQELIDRTDLSILKFIVFEEQGPIILDPLRKKVEKVPNVVVTSSFPNNIEINHVDAQKGVAVKRFAESLNIPMSKVMTIGDNFNDVSMLEMADVSFAMGNAEEGVKRIARYETANHELGGVGKAILRAIEENL